VTSTWYLENLTVRAWLFHIFPKLIRQRLNGRPVTRCQAFDASSWALGLASSMSWIAGTTVGRVDFRIMDIRDKNGMLIRLRVTYFDLTEVAQEIVSEEVFQQFVQGWTSQNRFPFYLAKNISTISLFDRYTLTRALLIIQICVWLRNKDGSDQREKLFLEQRPWLRNIQRYGQKYNIVVDSVGRSFSFRNLLLSCLSPSAIAAIRSMLWFRSRKSEIRNTKSEITIAVQHYGHLNVDQPEFYSDVFFGQNSAIAGKDLLMLFWMPQVPVDRATWDELSRHSIKGVALDPRSTRLAELPVFVPEARMLEGICNRLALKFDGSSEEQKWLRERLLNYEDRRQYWKDLFERFNARIHVTWYQVDGEHVAIADALQELGGVSAIYQRSLDFVSSSEMAIAADLFFGFSHDSVEREARNGSQIGYSVVTGYLGDHRFALLRNYAAQVRAELQKNGAEHIMAFFDENSSADARWHTGHQLQRETHAFLLEKVLEHRWFGLVLKPKQPGTLRARLGPVAVLLSKAIQTGRCHIFEGGSLYPKFPPAVAALAADIAVHGHLCAATAGMEAALAGVPTLLMDREGWPISPLYELGVGRVVFKSCEDLWQTYLTHSRSGMKVPGFGDWSTLLDRLDPFRDGQAAQRMGQYLQWVLDGLKEGLGRETALADAADRYCDSWGYDKVRTHQLNATSAVAAVYDRRFKNA
jgi:hypothetical protein